MVTDASKGNLIEQVVVCHVYCWTTSRAPQIGVPAARDHHRAFRGDLIEVTKDEARRGHELGGLANPEDEADGIAAVDELGEPYPAGEEGDAAIMAMNAGETVAYVGQHAGESQRVYNLERARKTARKGVLSTLGVNPDEPLPETLPQASVDETMANLTAAGGGPAAVG